MKKTCSLWMQSNDAVGIGQNNPQSPLHIGIETAFDLSYDNTGQDGVFIKGVKISVVSMLLEPPLVSGHPVDPGFGGCDINGTNLGRYRPGRFGLLCA